MVFILFSFSRSVIMEIKCSLCPEKSHKNKKAKPASSLPPSKPLCQPPALDSPRVHDGLLDLPSGLVSAWRPWPQAGPGMVPPRLHIAGLHLLPCSPGAGGAGSGIHDIQDIQSWLLKSPRLRHLSSSTVEHLSSAQVVILEARDSLEAQGFSLSRG